MSSSGSVNGSAPTHFRQIKGFAPLSWTETLSTMLEAELPQTATRIDRIQDLIGQLENNMCRVVLGKRKVVRDVIVALLAGEHVLLEDVPGVGKTLVGKALARSISGKFSRVQFTPDLLPGDVVGSNIFDSQTNEFKFIEGPIFSNIVLADEINRTTPRTQSALLEAMSDQQVSVDGTTRPLPEPFIIIATQNPYEFEGTYPLPESQLDRFLIRIRVGYPSREDELQVLTSHRAGDPVEKLVPVLTTDDVVALQAAVREVTVNEAIHQYLLDVIEATRTSDELQVGASTRGALCLYRAAQAFALVEGRDYCVPDDVKRLAVPVLAHRVIPRGYAHGSQRDAMETLIASLVEEVSVPN
jgi:MoxR-like ATPase